MNQKRGPGKAPAGTFEVLGRWAKDLGLDWFDLMKDLAVPRNSAWRIMDGTAGLEWAITIEAFLRIRAQEMGQTRNPAAQLREWTKIGMRLAKDQPEHFTNMLEVVNAQLKLLPPPAEEPFVFVLRKRKRRSPEKK